MYHTFPSRVAITCLGIPRFLGKPIYFPWYILYIIIYIMIYQRTSIVSPLYFYIMVRFIPNLSSPVSHHRCKLSTNQATSDAGVSGSTDETDETCRENRTAGSETCCLWICENRSSYVYMFIHWYTVWCVCTFLYIICINIYIYIYIHSTFVNYTVWIYACIYIYMHMYIYIYIHIHIIYIYTCAYIYM